MADNNSAESGQDASAEFICYPIILDRDILARYKRELKISTTTEALLAMASAISASLPPMDVVFAVRSTPQPVITIIADKRTLEAVNLVAQEKGIKRAVSDLIYINYQQAEDDCVLLAQKLSDHFGIGKLRSTNFIAIPRGGYFVLGMLAYILGLSHDQLLHTDDLDDTLVIVDDCAITGARFETLIHQYKNQNIIFAPLYSHPKLRAAIVGQEPRVRSCISAQDLEEVGQKHIGDRYSNWRREWLERLQEHRYWFGMTNHVCFAWNEPDRMVWNSMVGSVEKAWRLIPPGHCLKNRSLSPMNSSAIQRQPEGRGPLKPSERAVFGEINGRIVLGDIETGENIGLKNLAADIWKAIIEHGDRNQVIGALLAEYDVEEARLAQDLNAFVNDLLIRGLLAEET